MSKDIATLQQKTSRKPTQCGVCRAKVVLSSCEGMDALLEDHGGLLYPHVCPAGAVEFWRRKMDDLVRMSFRGLLRRKGV